MDNTKKFDDDKKNQLKEYINIYYKYKLQKAKVGLDLAAEKVEQWEELEQSDAIKKSLKVVAPKNNKNSDVVNQDFLALEQDIFTGDNIINFSILNYAIRMVDNCVYNLLTDLYDDDTQDLKFKIYYDVEEIDIISKIEVDKLEFSHEYLKLLSNQFGFFKLAQRYCLTDISDLKLNGLITNSKIYLKINFERYNKKLYVDSTFNDDNIVFIEINRIEAISDNFDDICKYIGLKTVVTIDNVAVGLNFFEAIMIIINTKIDLSNKGKDSNYKILNKIARLKTYDKSLYNALKTIGSFIKISQYLNEDICNVLLKEFTIIDDFIGSINIHRIVELYVEKNILAKVLVMNIEDSIMLNQTNKLVFNSLFKYILVHHRNLERMSNVTDEEIELFDKALANSLGLEVEELDQVTDMELDLLEEVVKKTRGKINSDSTYNEKSEKFNLALAEVNLQKAQDDLLEKISIHTKIRSNNYNIKSDELNNLVGGLEVALNNSNHSDLFEDSEDNNNGSTEGAQEISLKSKIKFDVNHIDRKTTNQNHINHGLIKVKDLNELEQKPKTTFYWIKPEDITNKIKSNTVMKEHIKIYYDILKNSMKPKIELTNEKITQILDIKKIMPNFSDIIDYFVGQLKLNSLTPMKPKFKPMLVLGEPGLGKTYIVKKISAILNTKFDFVDFGSMSASFILKGGNSQWKDGKYGKIAELFYTSPTVSPIMLFDELDKQDGSNKNYSPETVLYQLFEPENSSEFEDEFLEIKMDASSMIIFCTANTAEPIAKPLLSRVESFEVKRLDGEQTKTLTRAMYKDMVAEYSIFSDILDETIVERLKNLTPREITTQLRHIIIKNIEEINIEQLNTLQNNGEIMDLKYFNSNKANDKKIGF